MSQRVSCRSQLDSNPEVSGKAGAVQVFPNAACVVTLVDRLLHRAEIVTLEGSSYRLKEAQERAARKTSSRSQTSRKPH